MIAAFFATIVAGYLEDLQLASLDAYWEPRSELNQPGFGYVVRWTMPRPCLELRRYKPTTRCQMQSLEKIRHILFTSLASWLGPQRHSLERIGSVHTGGEIVFGQFDTDSEPMNRKWSLA